MKNWIAARTWIATALLCLIALKVALLLARGPAAIEMDAAQYWRLATWVGEGDVFFLSEKIANRTPLYPWFLAIVRGIAGPYGLPLIIALQGFFYVATAWMVSSLAVRMTKLPLARVWTLLLLLPATSAITFYAGVFTEPLFVFLLVANLVAVMDYLKFGRFRQVLWFSITFGLLLLTRPIAMFLWVPHLCFVLLIHWRRRSRMGNDHPARLRLGTRGLHGLVAAASVFALISPWLMRNQAMFSEPFLTQFVGRNLWIVTFQDGSGAGLELPTSKASIHLQRRLTTVGQEDDWVPTWTVSNALVDSGLDDSQADLLMQQVSKDAIRRNPEVWGKQAFRRIVNFWRTPVTDLPSPVPQPAFVSQRGWDLQRLGFNTDWLEWMVDHRLSRFVTVNTVILIVMILSLLGLMIHSPTRPYALWIGSVLLYFCVITGIFEIPAYRYRMVVEPIVAMTVGSAIAVGLSKRPKRAAKA